MFAKHSEPSRVNSESKTNVESEPIRIDAHQHFWDLSRSEFDYDWVKVPANAAINKNYLPENLVGHLTSTRMHYSVLVQTQHTLAENHWALSLAEQNPFIAGVVGWVDLASSDVEENLQQLQKHSKFVGIRHITQDEPDDDFIVRPDIRRGLGYLERLGIPFDLLFYEQHLHHAASLGQEFPNLPLVIDHLAKPKIKNGEIFDWEHGLRQAAQHSNIYCKLSGLVTEANWDNWTPDDLRPYIEIALAAFGPRRCMFGSDWPVCELAGSYPDVLAALQEVISSLSTEDQDWILGKTAMNFYSLQIGPPESHAL